MPNFSTHRIINYITLFLFLFIYFYTITEGKLDINEILVNFEQYYRQILIFIASYILGTELLSPDLDINSIPSKRLGIIYLPIRWLYGPHRGKLHSLFIGWIAQVFYLVLIGTIIWFILGKFGYNLEVFKYIDTDDIIDFLLGLFLSDGVHIITDKII